MLRGRAGGGKAAAGAAHGAQLCGQV